MKVERKQGLAWRKVGDEMVVIHLSRHRIFGLAGQASQIWEALAEAKDIGDLEAIVANGAPEGANVINAVSRFVIDLADQDLVEIAGDVPDPVDDDNVVVFEGPQIEWQEELQQFAGQCHLVPGQSHQCNQHPGGS